MLATRGLHDESPAGVFSKGPHNMGEVLFDLPFGHGQQSRQLVRRTQCSRQHVDEVLARSLTGRQHAVRGWCYTSLADLSPLSIRHAFKGSSTHGLVALFG